MSSKANYNPPLYQRVLIFVAGMPGYLLTFMPWIFVITIIFELSLSYSDNGTLSFPTGDIQFQQLNIGFVQILFWIFISAGLWVFIAWFVKRLMLHISRLFGDSERTWQTVKIVALVSGWAAVILIALTVFDNVQPGFLLSELIVTTVGLMSIGLEYLLTRAWHLKS